MTEINPELLEHLSYNAKEWAAYLETKTTETAEYETDSITTAFGRVRQEILNIVMSELISAINSTDEFSRPPLKNGLISAFSKDELVKVTLNGDIYFNAEEVAGDSGDFWDGVNYARAAMGAGGKNRTPEQRANYWRIMVYPSYGGGATGYEHEYDAEGVDADEDLWSKTIAWRFSAWGDLAPYWIFLEHGNHGSSYAYPRNRATNFLYKARNKAQGIFDMALSEVEIEASNLVEDALAQFIENPEKYSQFDVLDEFYASGRKYYIYVTSTKRIGVALPETYRGLQRR